MGNRMRYRDRTEPDYRNKIDKVVANPGLLKVR
jgi:hypothetical protein